MGYDRMAARNYPRSAFAAAVAAVLVCMAGALHAQELTLSLGEDGSLTARSVQLIALITVLRRAPGRALRLPCVPCLVTGLSSLRQGFGRQQAPPNMLIVSLALFLTYFVMDPVFRAAWEVGIGPLVEGRMSPEVAFERAIDPFRTFMSGRVDPDTLARLAQLRIDAGQVHLANADEPPLSLLVPSFMLSEVERAFQIGFLIFLPFLIIDMVVAAVLMSMGMMMVPPAVVALPFKLAFFVVADGWTLLSEALLRSYM